LFPDCILCVDLRDVAVALLDCLLKLVFLGLLFFITLRVVATSSSTSTSTSDSCVYRICQKNSDCADLTSTSQTVCGYEDCVNPSCTLSGEFCQTKEICDKACLPVATGVKTGYCRHAPTTSTSNSTTTPTGKCPYQYKICTARHVCREALGPTARCVNKRRCQSPSCSLDANCNPSICSDICLNSKKKYGYCKL